MLRSGVCQQHNALIYKVIVPMRTRIKICGLTRVADAVHAARCGADAIGMVFYPPSPRHIALEQARTISRALPAFVTRVALFVDADPAQVETVLTHVRPDLLQFHGDESPEYCRQFGVPYIKAARVKTDLNLVQYAALYADAQGLLLDAFVPGQPGGTGQSFDWALIPENLPLSLILSGGLEPENVRHAVQSVHPWAVDVSSGVEISKGIKDAAKVAKFIQEVGNADR